MGRQHLLNLSQRGLSVSNSNSRSLFSVSDWLGCQQSFETGSRNLCSWYGGRTASATRRGLSSYWQGIAILFTRLPKTLKKNDSKVSMSGIGNYYDNFTVETFFKFIKAELIWRDRWETRRQAEGVIFQYINGFYNPRRWRSSLGGKSHLAFERKAT